MGSFHPTLGGAISLQRISLVSTGVSGLIPSELGSLSNLKELLLVKTDLAGSIPEALCDFDLDELWADCDAVDCPCCNYCCYEGPIELCQTV